MCHDVELSEPQQIQLFMASLVNPLKTDVALRRPSTLDDAIMLAQAYEQRLHLGATDPIPERAVRALRMVLPAPSTASSTPSTDAASTTASGKQPLVAALPRKHLSPVEMAQRRTEGLCYNCHEKYVSGQHCEKSFIIEVISFPDDTEGEDDPPPAANTILADAGKLLISLHALAGIRALMFNTIKVCACVGTVDYLALLDSGSMHNFLSETVAHVRISSSSRAPASVSPSRMATASPRWDAARHSTSSSARPLSTLISTPFCWEGMTSSWAHIGSARSVRRCGTLLTNRFRSAQVTTK